MRILRVHNRYQQRGGEDVSFETETALLRRPEHQVKCLEFSNAEIAERPSGMDAARLALTTVWSGSARLRIAECIEQFHPKIVHFDNTFPLISPAAYAVCQERRVPVVQSLRNYRLLCPSANFFRDGHVCEDCLGKAVPYPGVVHACYRDSRTQTGAVAAMLTFHRLRQTWTRDVDHYVALTEFARNKFIEGGLPGERITVKPNFADIPAPEPAIQRGAMLYVGRLTPEKGIKTLLAAFGYSGNQKLGIIGDGPLSSDVRTSAERYDSIRYLGRCPEAKTYQHMASAQAVVVPSEWYEPFGRVVVEAYANCTPVIASRSGGLSELVDDGRTGLLFEPGNADDLAAKVLWAAEHPVEMRRMGENARREYEAKYTPERNYEMLMDIYEQAIAHARQRRA